jgi:hypothetical protein
MATPVVRTGEARWALRVLGSAGLASAGLVVHNVADLPGQSVLSPESSLPTLVSVALVILWLVPATRRLGAWLLLGWTTLNLVGGALSVLPLSFLPFAPEQSVTHYLFHVGYAVTQLPLLWVCLAWVRVHSRRGRGVRRGGRRQCRNPPGPPARLRTEGGRPSPAAPGGSSAP